MTKDDIIRMVHEAIAQTDGDDNIMDTPDWLEAFYHLAVAAGREACAEVADKHMQECEGKSFGVGKAIRARSQS